MHDKQVRRRRAVLALLVGVSLILLTAYFGESPGSPLHSVQRGIVQVLSPIQAGASKVLSPVRDVANWVSDTLRAKSQRNQLLSKVAQLNAKVAVLQSEAIQNAQLTKEVALDQRIGVAGYHPVSANVIGRDPTFWYQTVKIDKGSDAGIAAGDPALADGGLVGNVTTVDASVSIVTLITDHSFAVAAQVQDQSGDTGLLLPAVGSPNQLLLQDLPNRAPVTAGEQVVTAGFKSGRLQSLYPPGIPIGYVTKADQNQILNNGQVEVSPSADVRHFDFVQILTAPHAGSARAQAP